MTVLCICAAVEMPATRESLRETRSGLHKALGLELQYSNSNVSIPMLNANRAVMNVPVDYNVTKERESETKGQKGSVISHTIQQRSRGALP